MDVQVKELVGSWDLGYALHKHVLSSTYLGDNENGRAQFDTTRSEPGEALYQLKYRSDWTQVEPLAMQVYTTLVPLFKKISLIVPMPASTMRARQPVNELAKALGKLMDVRSFENIVQKTPAPAGSTPLKDMHSRQEKDAALIGRFNINDEISNDGSWNVLLLDDLFDSGATMDAVCQALRTYPKIKRIYAVAITWK